MKETHFKEGRSDEHALEIPKKISLLKKQVNDVVTKPQNQIQKYSKIMSQSYNLYEGFKKSETKLVQVESIQKRKENDISHDEFMRNCKISFFDKNDDFFQ